MTTRENTGVSESEKIWAALDLEDASGVPPVKKAADPVDTKVVADPVVVAAEEAAVVDEVAKPEQSMLDQIAGLTAQLQQVTGRLRNTEGRIGELNGKLTEQQKVAQQVAAIGKDAPTTAEIRTAQTNPVAMAKLKEDYPEFSAALELVLNERLSDIETRIAKQPAAVAAEPGITAKDIQQIRGELLVEVRHPGWLERVKTPEFHGWLQRQTREVQLLSESDKSNDAIRLLDIHAEQMKAATTTTRTRNLDSAAAIPSGRQGSNVRVKPVEEMTRQEYWAHLDQLESQKR